MPNTPPNRIEKGQYAQPDIAGRDGFDRVRIAESINLIEVTFENGKRDNEMGDVIVGGGASAYDDAEAARILSVTGASGDSILSLSHRIARTHVGASGYPVVTFKLADASAGLETEALVCDSAGTSGYAIGEDETGIYLAVYHPDAPGGRIRIDQADWNIATAASMGLTTLSTRYHTIHGSGSGMGLHHTVFKLDATPIHAVRGVPEAGGYDFPRLTGWRVGGRARNPILGTAGDMRLKGVSLISEAQEPPPKHPFEVSRGANVTAGPTELPVCSVRPADTFGGRDNPFGLDVEDILPVTTSTGILYKVYKQTGGTSPINGTWNAVSGTIYETNVDSTTWTAQPETQLIAAINAGASPLPIGRALLKRFGGSAPGRLDTLHVTVTAPAAGSPAADALVRGQALSIA